MSELQIAVTIPEELERDEDWCRKVTAVFSGGLARAAVSTETWLELPADESTSAGSAYYQVSDDLGENGWTRTVSGQFVSVGYTNLPKGHRNDYDHVLALWGATLEDGTRLANGRMVLVALGDVLNKQIDISALELGAANMYEHDLVESTGR